jgi:hypothetical protein
LVAPTRNTEPEIGNARAALAVVVGALAVATMPVAVFSTRYFEQYDLVHAGFAIPVGVIFGFSALLLCRAARVHDAVRLGRAGGTRAAHVGRVLAFAGLWLCGACIVTLGVYGLLEYLGTR